MNRFIVIALLATAVFAARLTPSTRLGFAFDDMLHNNLGAAEPATDATHSVSQEIKRGDFVTLQKYGQQELSWLNKKSLKALALAAKNVEEGHIEAHYIFQAFPEESVFRYALVNMIGAKDTVKFTVSQEERRAFGIRKANIYHDVKSSVLGLPFEKEAVLIASENETKEYHEFNRQRLLAAIKTLRGTQRTDMLGFDFMAALGNAKSAVESITGAWKEIVGAFKTVKKEEFKEKITGEGFSRFKSNSRYIRSIGIPNDKWALYKKSYMQLTRINTNPRVKDDAEALLELAEFLPENAWNANDFTFDINAGGSCNSFIALTRNDMIDQRSHVITVVTEGTFALAPHTLIYTKHKSIAGGIMENTKDVRKELPRGLTEADVKCINSMMLLNACTVMAENFGVPFKLPDLKSL